MNNRTHTSHNTPKREKKKGGGGRRIKKNRGREKRGNKHAHLGGKLNSVVPIPFLASLLGENSLGRIHVKSKKQQIAVTLSAEPFVTWFLSAKVPSSSLGQVCCARD